MKSNKKKQNNYPKKEQGITVIALIVAVIILVLLASISIGVLNNGLIDHAGSAKENTEIAGEKEILKQSILVATVKSKYNSFTQTSLQNAIDTNIGEKGKAKVSDEEDRIVVRFIDSNRYYEIDDKGNIKDYEPYVDTTPGTLAKNENDEFMIESIEDLVAFSAMVNGGYSNADISISSNQFSGATVVLARNLNFNSDLSYEDPTRKDYNGYLGISDENVTLKEALTSDEFNGFRPIGTYTSNSNKTFRGTFDGKNNKILNIFENNRQYSGLFAMVAKGTIIKNLIISGNIKNSTNYAGGIFAGVNAYDWSFSILNCTNYTNIQSSSCAGGIAGYVYCGNMNLENCKNYGIIRGSSAGGIAGYLKANPNGSGAMAYVKNSINNGNVFGNSNAGGIVGDSAYKVSVINCYNSVIANIDSEEYSGGIVGTNYSQGGNGFNNCYNLGTINGKYAGGIMGTYSWLYGAKAANCFSTAKITGTTTKAGISGDNGSRKLTSYNCYYIKNSNITKASGNGSLTNATGITTLNDTTITALNSYIESNEDSVDTTGWAWWELGSDGNPTLNFNKTWNGTEWVEEENVTD